MVEGGDCDDVSGDCDVSVGSIDIDAGDIVDDGDCLWLKMTDFVLPVICGGLSAHHDLSRARIGY